MLIKINGQPQMSFEQFEGTFRQVFGRDMTGDERRWIQLADFLDSQTPGLERRTCIVVTAVFPDSEFAAYSPKPADQPANNTQRKVAGQK
ncbi:MAG TPA: hypothetical protein VNX88_17435 [Terriglobales bacterium]|jgi:hypothetical protein|nr:hypothetical protein [Terriglobales bacterium]